MTVPTERVTWLRRLVLGYCLGWSLIRAPHWIDLARLPDGRARPVGVLSIADWRLETGAVGALVVLFVVAAGLALVNRRWTVTAPLAAVSFLVLTTHGNGWGQVLHTENLAALHLLIVAATPTSPDRARWLPQTLAVVTAATYFVAGVAKLRYGGLDWIDGELLRNLIAHDNLRKELLGDPSSPIAPWVVGWPWLFAPGAAVAVAVELLAPLALLHRRVAAAWVALAWFFHAAVLGLMAVLFLYPLLGIAFAPLLPVERLPERLRQLRRRPNASTDSPLTPA